MRPLILSLLLLLPGCVGLDSLRGVTDAAIDRAENVSDAALAGLEVAEMELITQIERVRAGRCRMPYTALVRWARLDAKNRGVLQRDCGLVITDLPGGVVPGRLPYHERDQES